MSHKNYRKIVEWHDAPSGFLYYPLDNDGNFIISPTTEALQVNLAKTKKTGFMEIKPDVKYLSGGETWKSEKSLLSQNYKNGKLLFPNAPPCLYSCERGGYYLLFRYVSGQNRVSVYTKSGVLKQTVFINDFGYSFNAAVFEVNQSANEFLIFGKIPDQAAPFSFDFTGFSSPPNLTNKWEAVARFSISESGDIEAPIDLAVVDYVEQWRGYFRVENYTTTRTDSSNSCHEQWLDTTTHNFSELWNQAVILAAYYDADVYKTVLFEPGTLTITEIGTDSYYRDIGFVSGFNPCRIVDVDAVYEQITESTRSENWLFKVKGVDCYKSYDYHNASHFKSVYVTTVINTSSGDYTIDDDFILMNLHIRYSKIQPYIQYLKNDTHLAPQNYYTRDYFDDTGTITDFSALSNSVPGHAKTTLWNNDLTKYILFIDPKQAFVSANQLASIAVDKHGNHFVASKVSEGGNYMNSVKITNKNLINIADISQEWNFGFSGVI
jgi:hypothetical protein